MVKITKVQPVTETYSIEGLSHNQMHLIREALLHREAFVHPSCAWKGLYLPLATQIEAAIKS